MTKNQKENPQAEIEPAPGADQPAPPTDKPAEITNLQFTNAETAKKYESLVTGDRDVHNARFYSGPLSKIPPAMAAAMIKGNSNLIKEK